MTEIRSPRLPRLLAAAAIGAAALLGSLAAASPAAAHDSLSGSSPEAGSTVESLPAEITLTFSGALLEGADARVVVIDEDCPAFSDLLADRDITSFEGDPSASIEGCTDYAQGDAVVEGAMVTQELAVDGAPAGGYAVLAGVVYGDTHPGTWALRFTAEEGAPAEATPSAPADEPSSEEQPTTEGPEASTAPPSTAPESPAPAEGDVGATALPWIIGGIVLVVGGTVVAVLIVRSRRSRDSS
jgi:hypothetical protein